MSRVESVAKIVLIAITFNSTDVFFSLKLVIVKGCFRKLLA